MAKKIEWSESALADRMEILEYWFQRNGNKNYSKKVDRSFRKTVKAITRYNLIAKKTDFENIRVADCKRYLIFCRIQNDLIEIVRIWNGFAEIPE